MTFPTLPESVVWFWSHLEDMSLQERKIGNWQQLLHYHTPVSATVADAMVSRYLRMNGSLALSRAPDLPMLQS